MATLNRELRRNVVISFTSVAVVVPIVWMVMDRDPPYVRSNGEVIAVDPSDCGLPGSTLYSASKLVHAGDCVEVKWDIKVIRNCPAAGGDNVVRQLRDSIGITKPVGSLTRSSFESDAPTATVRQLLVLPSPMPAGRTIFISNACFACNPLQQLWPICIDKPDIEFEVEK